MYDTSWMANVGGGGWGVVVTGGGAGGYGTYYPGYIPPNQTIVTGQTNQILLLGLLVVGAVLLMK